jgi:chemotaxis protein MotB
MKKKKIRKNVNEVLPGWMASYADMFTILMVFFVLLFAMSQVDAELFERFLVSYNPARADDRILRGAGDMFLNEGAGLLNSPVEPPPAGAEGDEGGLGPDDPTWLGGYEPSGDAVSDMYNTFKTYMAENIPQIVIEERDNFINIRIDNESDDTLFFNAGEAVLNPAGRNILNVLGPRLKDFSDRGHGIIVEGHTDNQAISNLRFPSNWTLSCVRASSVVEYLVGNFGIDAKMIAGLGRGEHFPIDDNSTREGRERNRRVEIKVFAANEATSQAIGGWFIPGTR